MTKVATFLYALVIASSAQAGPVNQTRKAISIGTGNDSCGTLLLAYEKHPMGEYLEYDGESLFTGTHVYVQWVSGYISGYSFSHGRPRKYFETEGMGMWIRQYCEDNPTNSVLQAAIAFVNAHFKARK